MDKFRSFASLPEAPLDQTQIDNVCPAMDFITVTEAARLLRVNRKTLYEAIARREVPGVVRLGRVIRIQRDAMLRWYEGQSRSPQSGNSR